MKKLTIKELELGMVFVLHSNLWYTKGNEEFDDSEWFTLSPGSVIELIGISDQACYFKVQKDIDKHLSKNAEIYVKLESFEEYLSDTCPYCGKRYSLPGNAFRNLETYHPNGSCITHTTCCNTGVVLSAKIHYTSRPYTGPNTEDDWGIPIIINKN